MAKEKLVLVAEGTLCDACGHTFHYGKCFHTAQVGARYLRCTCKKGVVPSDN